MYKKIVLTCLLVIWMLVIFMFSNANGTNSQKTSDGLTKSVINTVSKVTKKKVSKKQENKIIQDTSFIVRKTAHFTIYLILGVLVYLTLNSYGINKRIIIYSGIFCMLYAISDEIHQLFSDGRAFMILDIFIDTIGGIIGVFIINKIVKHISKYEKSCFF